MRKQGTNKYQDKYHYPLGLSKQVFWDAIWIVTLLLLIGAIFAMLQRPTKDFISPIPKGYLPTIVKTVYAGEKDDDIVGYIRQVFGEKYADQAIKVAYCESRLNPKARGDGGNSIGTFQINIRWHKIMPKFLLNPKINILVAKQLFDENHSKWNLWSCRP